MPHEDSVAVGEDGERQLELALHRAESFGWIAGDGDDVDRPAVSGQRTREQKFSKAKITSEFGIADGKVLGYRNVAEHKQRRREIDPEQAKLVTRIFEMSAAGMGYLKIASTLNRERVKNPNGQARDNRTSADQFSASGVKAILERELYRGKLVYGKTRNV